MTVSANLPRFEPRARDSHKGDYGQALLIGGSRGMAGAIGLSGMAALRAGAGLVTLAVPDVCQNTVAGFEPSYMTVGIDSDNDGRIALSAKSTIDTHASKATCLGCGPGIGRSADIDQLVRLLWQELPHPVVFDADGLNALAAERDSLGAPGGPRILTPHPGEFRRLAGESDIDVVECRRRAGQVAQQYRATLVLKGNRTVITDGNRIVENETGNPGMATGGSGDVLTGLIVGLLGHGMDPFTASTAAVHVHGLAGDIAAAELTETSLIASDLVRFLPAAFKYVRDAQANNETG